MPWWVVPLVTFIVMIVAAIAGEHWTVYQPVTYIQAHPVFCAVSLIGYLLFGAVYSVVKWWMHVRSTRKVYLKFRLVHIAGWAAEDANSGYPSSERYYLADGRISDQGESEILSRFSSKRDFNIPLLVSDHRDLISLWVTLWVINIPFSILAFISNKVLSVPLLGQVMQRMSDRAFAPPI